MAADPNEYGIELPLLVRETAEEMEIQELAELSEAEEFPAGDPAEEKRGRSERKEKTESGRRKTSGSRSAERQKEQKQSEQDWNAYLKGEPLAEEEPAEPAPRRKGLTAGGIILLILGILMVLAAAALSYMFIVFYLPLVRNGTTFGRLFKSMMLFIGLPWIAAAILLTFAFTVGKRK